MKAELQPQGKHEEDNADFGPYLNIGHVHNGGNGYGQVDSGQGVFKDNGQIRARQQSGCDISQDQGLVEFLEQHGYDAGHQQDEGQI